jgi:TM2 domain-containing membrane protein YozV
MLKQENVEAEEESLRQVIRDLSDEKRRNFYQMAGKQLKDPDTYATLNWFFMVGLHHFYLKRWGRGLIDIAALIVAIWLFVSGAGLLAACLLAVIYAWEFWELCRSQIIVQDWNNRLYRDLLRRV